MSEDYRIKKLLLAEAKGHLAAMSNPAFKVGPDLKKPTGERWSRLVAEIAENYGEFYSRFELEPTTTDTFQ